MHYTMYLQKIVKDMEQECPLGKTVSKDKYYDIASKWLVDMKLALSVNSFTPEENETRVQLKELRKKFNFRYGKQQYWFAWFTKNYPLWKEIEKGYAIGSKKMATKIQLLFNELEYFEGFDPGDLFEIYYRDYILPKLNENTEVIWQQYDAQSLINYIQDAETRINTAPNKTYRDTIMTNLIKARQILAFTDTSKTIVTETFGPTFETCFFPVVVKKSAFGRTYHLGLNLQNAKKEFRAAALGKCTSIDINASVYGCYHQLLSAMGYQAPYALNEMIDNRKQFRTQLAERVFQNTEGLSAQYKYEIIKEALTAIGFGAKEQDYKTNSINKIIKNKDDRAIFQSDPKVQELRQVVEVLLETARNMEFSDDELKVIKGEDKKMDYKKALSYIYQQYEKDIRNKMIAVAEAQGGEVILQTHDGIFVTGVNASELAYDLDYTLTKKNPIIKFDIDKQTQFKKKVRMSVDREAEEHYAFIAEQEKKAANLHRTGEVEVLAPKTNIVDNIISGQKEAENRRILEERLNTYR